MKANKGPDESKFTKTKAFCQPPILAIFSSFLFF